MNIIAYLYGFFYYCLPSLMGFLWCLRISTIVIFELLLISMSFLLTTHLVGFQSYGFTTNAFLLTTWPYGFLLAVRLYGFLILLVFKFLLLMPTSFYCWCLQVSIAAYGNLIVSVFYDVFILYDELDTIAAMLQLERECWELQYI